jgi:hypothetical protein
MVFMQTNNSYSCIKNLIFVHNGFSRDHNDWLMCYHCGKVYAKWETKTEDKLKQFAENIDSPFDSASNITGLDNKRSRLTPIQKQRKRQLEEADKQKDPEIRALKRRGIQVDIIEDGLDY